MSATAPRVTICLVTHDSARDIAGCLESVGRLRYRPLDIVVVDCASRDESPAIVHRAAPQSLPLELVVLDDNLGFAGGMNRALQETDAPYVLTLNPDTRPEPTFVDALIQRAESMQGQQVGAVAGRLLRPREIGHRARIDACGMKLILSWRHLDRGSGLDDQGQWTRPEKVFGTTAAAALFRREALDDVAVDHEIFAAEFHSYREDAELCFRLRERGWEVLYEPQAVCTHRRAVTPELRRELSAEINYHSLKNRYLLRAYHQDVPNLLLTLVPTLWRDLLALIYVITRERTSLSAYGWLWRHRSAIRQRRRRIRERRTCGSWQINRWFLHKSLPL